MKNTQIKSYLRDIKNELSNAKDCGILNAYLKIPVQSYYEVITTLNILLDEFEDRIEEAYRQKHKDDEEEEEEDDE